jgi:hypothetical protein
MKKIMTLKIKLNGILLKSGLYLFLCLLSINYSYAQDQTSSPYSRFGVGDLLSRNFGRGEAMGGLGIGLSERSNLNLINPAGIGKMDTMQFLFEMGVNDRVTLLKSSSVSKSTNNVGFSYLAMGFPIIPKFWKASVGIMPYSGVGYFMSDTKIDPAIGQVSTEFAGNGGISEFFIQNAFRPDKFQYLSLGFTLSYLFGPMTQSKTLIFPEDSTYFSTRSQTSSIVNDIHLSYGAQLHFPIKKDYFLNIGGVFENQSDIRTESRELVYASGLGISDTLFYREDPNNSIILPKAFGGGVSFGKENKFTIGADYRTMNWENALFLGQQDSLSNSQELIIGMEYIPDAVNPMYYYKRMSYRGGFKYGKSYIQLRETQINEFGITFGVGLPVRADRGGRPSLLNISAELGKRGTIENNLISEFYGLLSVQLTLRDIWFFKIKYD